MKRLLEIVLNAEGAVGGEQKHVAQILAGLDRARYTADVVTWDIPQFVAELRGAGVDTMAVSGTHVLDVGMINRLTDYIKQRDYDLVHCHGHRAGFVGRLAAIRAHAPEIVWTCHVAPNKADANPVLRSAYAAALRWLGRRSNAIIAVSSQLRDWLVSLGIDRDSIEVIYNCVDSRQFSPRSADAHIAAALGIDPDRPTVGTIARLTEQKGLECLLSAAPVVLEHRPDVQFVIVGGGPLAQSLEQQARDLGVERNVIFAGERSGIPDIIATFDLAVFPSRWEGFAYAPLEVMASGKPIVCSDIPPFREIVKDNETGLIFPSESAADLAAAVLRLVDDPAEARRLANQGYELVKHEFDLPVMQQRTIGIYERLLGERTPR